MRPGSRPDGCRQSRILRRPGLCEASSPWGPGSPQKRLMCHPGKAAGSPDANDLPPGATSKHPYSDVEYRHDEAQAVPLGLGDIASTEVGWGRPDAIGREAAHDIGELGQKEGCWKGWCPSCNGHRQEGSVHGTDVGGSRGKQVVGVEVEEHNEGECWLPGHAKAIHNAHHLHLTGSSQTLASAM